MLMYKTKNIYVVTMIGILCVASYNCVAMQPAASSAKAKVKRHWQVEFDGRLKELEQLKNVPEHIAWLKKFKNIIVDYGFITTDELGALIEGRVNAGGLKINSSPLRLPAQIEYKYQPQSSVIKQPQKRVQEKQVPSPAPLESQDRSWIQIRRDQFLKKDSLGKARIDKFIAQLTSPYVPSKNDVAHPLTNPTQKFVDLLIDIFWRAAQANDYNAMMNIYTNYLCNSRYNDYILGFVMNKLKDAIDRNEPVFIFDLFQYFIKNTQLRDRAFETLIIAIKQGKLDPDTWGIIALCFVDAPSHYAAEILQLIAKQQQTTAKIYTQSLVDHYKLFREAVAKHNMGEVYKHQNYIVGPVLDQKLYNAIVESLMK